MVSQRGGELNNGPTLLHYRLQSTVYNSSSRSQHTFPITAYFKNGQRWVNFPPLAPNTQVFITGRIFGVTKENQQLAIITDDIHFLPSLTQPLPPSPSSTTGKRKREDRWAQRATPTTPLKSARLLNTTVSSHQNDILHVQDSHERVEITEPDDDRDTQITWTETADEAESSPQLNSPTPERRSQRPRKTSYADVLAISK